MSQAIVIVRQTITGHIKASLLQNSFEILICLLGNKHKGTFATLNRHRLTFRLWPSLIFSKTQDSEAILQFCWSPFVFTGSSCTSEEIKFGKGHPSDQIAPIITFYLSNKNKACETTSKTSTSYRFHCNDFCGSTGPDKKIDSVDVITSCFTNPVSFCHGQCKKRH
jgi:hypothetical protein